MGVSREVVSRIGSQIGRPCASPPVADNDLTILSVCRIDDEQRLLPKFPSYTQLARHMRLSNRIARILPVIAKRTKNSLANISAKNFCVSLSGEAREIPESHYKVAPSNRKIMT